MTLAALRPDEWDLPLFVHVLGAMLLVGTLFAVVVALWVAWSREDDSGRALRRFGLWGLVLGVVPSFVVMRAGAQWIYDEEGFGGDDDPGWVGFGYVVADVGVPVLLIALILAIVALVRTRREETPRMIGRVVAVIATLLLAAYLVAVWAMTAKP